ncbi:ankyrin [Neoconidiobolus thromboides FSU 785]|nr:ankyrin [Neoconidiobolus thromboides FSU 785]
MTSLDIGPRDVSMSKKKSYERERGFQRPRSNSLVLTSLPNKKMGLVNLNTNNKNINEPEDLLLLDLLFKSISDKNYQTIDFLLKNLNSKQYLINSSYKEWDQSEVKTMKKVGPMTLLAKACYLNDLGIVILLKSRGADLNLFNGLALRVAVDQRNLEIVQYLISNGILLPKLNPEQFQHPLTLAVKEGDLEMMNLLLLTPINNKECIDKTIFDHLLFNACKEGHYNIVLIVLEKYQQFNFKLDFNPKFKPLYLAMENGHYQIVRLLLDKVFDPISSPLSSSPSLSPISEIIQLDVDSKEKLTEPVEFKLPA